MGYVVGCRKDRVGQLLVVNFRMVEGVMSSSCSTSTQFSSPSGIKRYVQGNNHSASNAHHHPPAVFIAYRRKLHASGRVDDVVGHLVD
jgi:hypothetical protein